MPHERGEPARTIDHGYRGLLPIDEFQDAAANETSLFRHEESRWKVKQTVGTHIAGGEGIDLDGGDVVPFGPEALHHGRCAVCN